MADVMTPTEATTDEEAGSRLARIQEYHSPRRRTVDGYTLRWCRECQQDWPCPTAEAVEGKW